MTLFSRPNEKNIYNCWKKEIEFAYDDSEKIDGVMAHLTREYGGNVHHRGYLNATQGCVESCSYQLTNAVDIGANSCYSPKNEPNSWMYCEFKNHRAIPTISSVRPYSTSPWCGDRKSFGIEVSNNGTKNS